MCGSADGYATRPEALWSLVAQTLCRDNPLPNGAHRALAQLERSGKVSCVITQNIDNLHQMAGSRRVVEVSERARRRGLCGPASA